MPFATKTVKLSKPVEAFGKVYAELVIREPRASEFLDLGPLSTSYRVGELESTHDLPKVLTAYLAKCVTNLDDPSVTLPVIFHELGLEDGIRVRRVFNQLFSEAAEAVLADEKTRDGFFEPQL